MCVLCPCVRKQTVPHLPPVNKVVYTLPMDNRETMNERMFSRRKGRQFSKDTLSAEDDDVMTEDYSSAWLPTTVRTTLVSLKAVFGQLANDDDGWEEGPRQTRDMKCAN